MHAGFFRGGVFLLLASIALSSCSNADTQKRRHLERGDQYAAEKRDDFAVVEYASAVKIDPMFGEARLKLAETHERMGNLQAAMPEYVRAADALPDNREIQLKATRILLLAGRFEDARARVETLLQKDPRDVDAILLRANAMAAMKDPASATTEIEEALKISPDSSQAYVNLGAVKMQAGENKEAEAALRRAVDLDRASVDPKLALAMFLTTNQRSSEAETILKDILTKDPNQVLANRMLHVLYMSTGRVAEAEQPLKTVVNASKSTAARLQLADYYVTADRPKDAIAVLNALSSDPTTAVDAEMRLAALDYAEGRGGEAHKRLDALMAKAPNYSAALVMKAQWLSKETKLDEALARAKAAVAADPQSATAHFTLARIQDQRKEFDDAAKSYTETLRLNPRAVQAQVELSRLSLRTGDSATALRYAEDAQRNQPGSVEVRLATVRSLIASGNLPRAQTEIDQLLKQAPNNAAVHAANGMLLATKNNVASARQSFERALQLSPGFLPALGGLTYLDLSTKNFAPSISRLEAEIAKQPNNGALYVMLAQSFRGVGDSTKEEQTLRRAVSADPRMMEGYGLLAEFYLRHKRTDEARAEFEGIVKREPSNVGARTMVAVLLEQQGKADEARKTYETMANDAQNAPVAANNLAYIYAEQGINLDTALQLAQTAKQRLPDNPSVDDTIGWIYYKKDLPALAVKPFEESLKKRPDSPDVLFHLGLTYAKLGEKAKAKETLERALKLDPKVGGEEARRVLQTVTQ